MQPTHVPMRFVVIDFISISSLGKKFFLSVVKLEITTIPNKFQIVSIFNFQQNLVSNCRNFQFPVQNRDQSSHQHTVVKGAGRLGRK